MCNPENDVGEDIYKGNLQHFIHKDRTVGGNHLRDCEGRPIKGDINEIIKGSQPGMTTTNGKSSIFSSGCHEEALTVLPSFPRLRAKEPSLEKGSSMNKFLRKNGKMEHRA
ncbi:hypothetical protein V6N13_083186 [Hibiscus sabdariffa]|uniref:Uncharacterized protein n=1 Tax=Hibiscus sabdariffa TaxID=183260 RepID=A0ABR2SXG2_9ROSI